MCCRVDTVCWTTEEEKWKERDRKEDQTLCGSTWQNASCLKGGASIDRLQQTKKPSFKRLS